MAARRRSPGDPAQSTAPGDPPLARRRDSLPSAPPPLPDLADHRATPHDPHRHARSGVGRTPSTLTGRPRLTPPDSPRDVAARHVDPLRAEPPRDQVSRSSHDQVCPSVAIHVFNFKFYFC